MKRQWTVETAQAYVTSVEMGRRPRGLTWCSAFDFLHKVGANMPTKAKKKQTKK